MMRYFIGIREKILDLEYYMQVEPTIMCEGRFREIISYPALLAKTLIYHTAFFLYGVI